LLNLFYIPEEPSGCIYGCPIRLYSFSIPFTNSFLKQTLVCIVFVRGCWQRDESFSLLCCCRLTIKDDACK
jgi:hypothetical protein